MCDNPLVSFFFLILTLFPTFPSPFPLRLAVGSISKYVLENTQKNIIIVNDFHLHEKEKKREGEKEEVKKEVKEGEDELVGLKDAWDWEGKKVAGFVVVVINVV